MAKLHPLLQEKWDALGDAAHKQLSDRAKKMNLPFWWHGPTPDDAEIYHNGTLSLVDTGEKVIGITAWHVWNAYRQDLEKRPRFVCQFGGVTVAPEALHLADDERLELATFNLSTLYEQLQEFGFVAHRPQVWPPSRPDVQDLVIYGGFPGVERKPGPVEVVFYLNTVTSLVSQVTSQNVVVEVNYSRLSDADDPHQGNVVAFDPAGSSGGPVYRIIDMPRGPDLEIVAFIYEQSKDFHFMLARHVEFIRSDGMLAM
jgi:hypothetical protein